MHSGEFGRSGWQLREVSFGGWQLGGEWGEVDDEASLTTLHHAWAWTSRLSSTGKGS